MKGLSGDGTAAIGRGRVARRREYFFWEDPENYANSTEIRARLYDSELDATGADFRINTVDMNAQDLPRVADYGPKGFLVTWESLLLRFNAFL